MIVSPQEPTRRAGDIGGVDVPIFSRIDFRAVEIGGGKGYIANSGVSNNTFSNTNTQISLFSIDTGIVVRF